MTRVLVTPRSLTSAGAEAPELAALRDAGVELVLGPAGRQPSEDELLALVPGCAGWLAGVEPVTRRVLEAAADLRIIARNGAGVDSIDLAAAEDLGIAVRRAPGANARGVAELTIGLVLAALRGIPASAAALRDGGWERTRGREVEGRTLGVVGAGAVGRLVLALARGLGMRTLATDPFAGGDVDGTPVVELDELLGRSDVVSLHSPAQPDGRPLLDAARLARTRAGALIVNTARAGLVDDGALLAALDAGHVGGYAVDVFDPEPPEPGPLLAHPRVIATAHIGGFTEESVARATAAAIDELLRALGGSIATQDAERREG